MTTVADISREELEQLLGNEIAKARTEVRPISRLTLTKLLQSTYALHLHDAERYVDEYCDDKAPAVPTFLSTEFGVPYLKIVGIAQVVLAVMVVLFPVVFPRADLTLWPAAIIGAALAVSGGLCVFRSLNPSQEKPGRPLATELPRIAVSSEEPKATVIGSYQSRN